MSKKILLTDEQEKQICELTINKTQSEIAKQFNLSQSYIHGIIKKHKINFGGRFRFNKTILKVDVNYFDIIDSNKKAYWLGYLSADGHINKINTKCTLTSIDLEIIQKFKDDIKSEHKISENFNLDKRTKKTYKHYTIQITNKNFVLNLNKHGITQFKSDVFNVPKMDEKYLSYFFAGMFDGDGCVGERKNNKPRISLISTKEVLLFLQKYLMDKLNISKTKLQRVTINKNNVWKISLYGDSLLFLNWIYSDNNFNYLNRKHEKYLSFIR